MNRNSRKLILMPRSRFRANAGFTLIEAVIAIGVFGFSIAIILALFLKGTAHLSEVEDRAQVRGLMEHVNAKIEEIGWSSAMNGSSSGVLELTDGGALLLVANREGSWVARATETDVIEAQDQYYLLEVTRYNEPGHQFGTDLRGVLVLNVKIAWPYRLPAQNGFVETELEDRKVFEFLSTVRP